MDPEQGSMEKESRERVTTRSKKEKGAKVGTPQKNDRLRRGDRRSVRDTTSFKRGDIVINKRGKDGESDQKRRMKGTALRGKPGDRKGRDVERERSSRNKVVR